MARQKIVELTLSGNAKRTGGKGMCWEEQMSKKDECDMEKFGALLIDYSKKTIADRWWPQKAKLEGGNVSKVV